ncbi:MAG: hypothetical protein IKT65_01720 [Clostridia bacterium]|nr:hypothetical protein [Clostridia bacterium]
MKKTYTAPDVFYEDFSITTNIASACEEKTNAAKWECGYEYLPGLNIFASNIPGCHITNGVLEQDGDAIWDSLCYHVPIDDYNLFNS